MNAPQSIALIKTGRVLYRWEAALIRSLESAFGAAVSVWTTPLSFSGRATHGLYALERRVRPQSNDALAPEPAAAALNELAGDVLALPAAADLVINVSDRRVEPRDVPVVELGSVEALLDCAASAVFRNADALRFEARLVRDGQAQRLLETHVSGNGVSVQKLMSAVLWKLPDLLPRRLLQVLENASPISHTGPLADAPRRPLRTWAALPLIALAATVRQVRVQLARRRPPEPWCLLFGPGAQREALTAGRFTRLVATPDRLWADPFIIRHEGTWYVYLEEMEYRTMRGEILCLRLDERFQIVERRTVLSKPYHLSYPHLFFVEDTLYMMPESAENGTVDLYRCTEFPWHWEHERTLLSGLRIMDSSLLRHDGKWWLFSIVQPAPGAPVTDELHIHFAERLEGPWTTHPLNPVLSDARRARPAGRLFFHDGVLIRPAQNCAGGYGRNIVLNRVMRLSETEYAEEVLENVPLPPGCTTMHHVDSYEGLTVADATIRP